MHSETFEAEPGRPTRFHFNADLSGDVIINVPYEAIEAVPGDLETAQVRVPAANLQALIGSAVRDELISRLEQIDPIRMLALFVDLLPR